MKLVCNTIKQAEAIKCDKEREKFLKSHNPARQPYIEMQTYSRWTSEQQRKIWRDFGIVAELLETTPEAIYSIIKGDKSPCSEMFFEIEWVGKNGRGKTVRSDKGLSRFTKQDCIELIPVMCEYLELLVNQIYQEKIIINWSCKENKKSGRPDFEETGEAFDIEQKVIEVLG